MSDQSRLEQLLRGRHTVITMLTDEEEYALQFVRDAALNLGRDLRVWKFTRGLHDGLVSDAPTASATEHPAAALYQLAQGSESRTCVMLDLLGHLKDAKTLRLLRDLIAHFQHTEGQLILIDHASEVPEVLQATATPFQISYPDEDELNDLIRETLVKMNKKEKISVQMTRSGLQTIIRNLRGLTRAQARRIITDCVVEDCRFDEDDINHVTARKRQMIQRGGLLEFVETPVDLKEIGGLKRLKQWLSPRKEAVSDKAKEYGLIAPRGVLMLGVQGAGKSLCAKAIATAWQRPLLRMEVGALYDRYVGESERRLRDALHQAEMMAPIILWIDEIEKAFASAASRSTDGGLSQRMFGTLLTWMQEHDAPVFLVATANDIEALPPELLRKGRFDEIFFVDLPDEKVRAKIFEIHLRKRGRDPKEFDLKALARAADGFSGAEIEQAVVGGLHDAFASKSEVTTEHILKVAENSPPLSVTMAERINALREWASDRCVPAD